MDTTRNVQSFGIIGRSGAVHCQLAIGYGITRGRINRKRGRPNGANSEIFNNFQGPGN